MVPILFHPRLWHLRDIIFGFFEPLWRNAISFFVFYFSASDSSWRKRKSEDLFGPRSFPSIHRQDRVGYNSTNKCHGRGTVDAFLWYFWCGTLMEISLNWTWEYLQLERGDFGWLDRLLLYHPPTPYNHGPRPRDQYCLPQKFWTANLLIMIPRANPQLSFHKMYCILKMMTFHLEKKETLEVLEEPFKVYKYIYIYIYTT